MLIFRPLSGSQRVGGFSTGRGRWEMEAVLTIMLRGKRKVESSAMSFSDNVQNALGTPRKHGWDLTLPENGYAVDKEAPKFDRENLGMKLYWNSKPIA